MPRAWHGWCVAYVVFTLPGTHLCYVGIGHVYVLLWRGCRGQAGAGLGQLRSPAVRNLFRRCCLSWRFLSRRCCCGACPGPITSLTLELYIISTVTCVKWRVWRRCGCREAALARRCVGRRSFWSMVSPGGIIYMKGAPRYRFVVDCSLIATALELIPVCNNIVCEVACAEST